MKRKYVGRFFSTKTGSQYCAEQFANYPNNERKRIKIFKFNEAKWKGAVGEGVKGWLGTRLEGLLEEKPGWFDDKTKASIPDWAVEDKALLMKVGNKNVEHIVSRRRRSSLLQTLTTQEE